MLKRFKKEEFHVNIRDYKDLIGIQKFRKCSCIKNISSRSDLIDVFDKFRKDFPQFNHYNNRDIVYTLIMINNISDLQNIPICKCGKTCVPRSYVCGYDTPTFRNTCYDSKCIHQSMYITLQKSIREKYGVNNISSLDDIKKKKIDSYLQHYGVDNPMKNADCLKKLSKTMKEIYGVDNISKCDNIKEKKLKTLLSHYGSMENVIELTFQNFYKRCGIKNISQLNYIKDKKKQTFLKHYNVDNVFKDPNMIQYIKDYWKQHPDLYKKNLEKLSESVKKSKKNITGYRRGQTGVMEFEILNEIEKEIGIKIYRQVGVMQYYMDGYIKDYNIMIEYDEPEHRNQIQEDNVRQKEIVDYIQCSVIRIKEEDWLIDSNKVIEMIKSTINICKKLNNIPKLVLEDKTEKIRLRKDL